MSVCLLPSSPTAAPTTGFGVRLTGLLLTGLLLVGCGTSAPQGPDPKPNPTATQTATETAEPTEAPEKPSFVPVGNVEVGQGHVLLGDLDQATGLTALPNNEFLITQGQTGQFLWLNESGEVTAVTGPAADQLSQEIGPAAANNTEMPRPVPGIFGVALSPDFANDSLLYAFVSLGTESKVVALAWDDGHITHERDVLTALPAGEGRNGGALGFGPDGYLYVSVGDSGIPELAQEVTSEAGKILRIAVDGTAPGNNPLSQSTVWSLGHRNVTGFTWTDQGAMYAVEQGESIADELNLIIPGANYGWPLVEGTGHEGEGDSSAGAGMSAQEALDRGFTAPALAWQWSQQKLTTADPVGIVATHEGLYIPGFNGQRLWRVGLLENGLALTQEFYTQSFGPLGDIALGSENSLVFLTANTVRNPGARSVALPAQSSEEPPLSTRDRLIEFTVTY